MKSRPSSKTVGVDTPRIMQLGQRQGDASQQAILEFVDLPLTAPEPAKTDGEGKTAAAAS